jgi:hypothetical protein
MWVAYLFRMDLIKSNYWTIYSDFIDISWLLGNFAWAHVHLPTVQGQNIKIPNLI